MSIFSIILVVDKEKIYFHNYIGHAMCCLVVELVQCSKFSDNTFLFSWNQVNHLHYFDVSFRVKGFFCRLKNLSYMDNS